MDDLQQDEQDELDGLEPARGVMYGVILAAIMWVVGWAVGMALWRWLYE